MVAVIVLYVNHLPMLYLCYRVCNYKLWLLSMETKDQFRQLIIETMWVKNSAPAYCGSTMNRTYWVINTSIVGRERLYLIYIICDDEGYMIHTTWIPIFVYYWILFFAGIFTEFQNAAYLKGVDITVLSIPSKDKNKKSDKNYQKTQTIKNPCLSQAGVLYQ